MPYTDADYKYERQPPNKKLRWHHCVLVFTTLLLFVGAVILFRASTLPASGQVTCTTVLSSGGNLQSTINAAHPGDTICLAASSVFNLSSNLSLQTSSGTSGNPITITSQDRTHMATINGRIVTSPGGDYFTLSWLNLNGANGGNLPSPTIGSDHISLLNNDITNSHTAICINDINSGFGVAHYTVIDHNRIHDCGRLPATNGDHGLYESGFNAQITNNYIYNNADRGIQLRGAQSAVVENNVVDGNGEGVIFGDLSASNNLVDHNIFSNSNVRFNVEYFWGSDPVGSGNVFSNNCVWTTVSGFYGSNQSIEPGTNGNGVTISNVTFADPLYTNAASHDYTLQNGSPCTAMVPSPVDITPPTVSISAPTNGATVSGTTTVSANASDDTGVTSVQFQLDGSNLGSLDTTSPYSYSWDTTSPSDGSHSLTAIASDAAGNTTTSSTVTVNVDNSVSSPGSTTPDSGPTSSSGGTSAVASTATGVIKRVLAATSGVVAPITAALTAGSSSAPPVISNIKLSGVNDHGITVTWQTDVPATSIINYGLTDTYGSTARADGLATSHKVVLNSPKITKGNTYYLSVTSANAAGISATSTAQQFSTPGFDVTIRILDSRGKAIKNADVSIANQTAVSNDTGFVTLRSLSAGKHDVTIQVGREITTRTIKVGVYDPATGTYQKQEFSLTAATGPAYPSWFYATFLIIIVLGATALFVRPVRSLGTPLSQILHRSGQQTFKSPASDIDVRANLSPFETDLSGETSPNAAISDPADQAPNTLHTAPVQTATSMPGIEQGSTAPGTVFRPLQTQN